MAAWRYEMSLLLHVLKYFLTREEKLRISKRPGKARYSIGDLFTCEDYFLLVKVSCFSRESSPGISLVFIY